MRSPFSNLRTRQSLRRMPRSGSVGRKFCGSIRLKGGSRRSQSTSSSVISGPNGTSHLWGREIPTSSVNLVLRLGRSGLGGPFVTARGGHELVEGGELAPVVALSELLIGCAHRL